MQRPLSNVETLAHKLERRTIGGKPCWASFEPLLCTWEQKGLKMTREAKQLRRERVLNFKKQRSSGKERQAEMVKMSRIQGLGRVRSSGVKNC